MSSPSLLPPPSRQPILGLAVCVVALACGVGAGFLWRNYGGEPALLRQRRAEVAALPPSQRGQLRRQFDRFQKENSATRARLQEMHAELSASPDQEDLLATLRQFQAWLGAISITERAELTKLADDPVRRVERLQELLPLSTADAEALNQWLISTVKERWRNSPFPLPGDAQILAFAQRMFDGRFGERPPFVKVGRNEGVDMKDMDRLAASLSEQRREELENKPNLAEKRGLIASWVQRRRGQGDTRGGFVSNDELVRFYTEELAPNVQKRLLAMPLEQRNRELREQYRRAKLPESIRRQPERIEPAT